MYLSISLGRRILILPSSRYLLRADSNKSCSRNRGYRVSYSPTSILRTWFVQQEMLICLDTAREEATAAADTDPSRESWGCCKQVCRILEKSGAPEPAWAGGEPGEPQRGGDTALSPEQTAQVHRWRRSHSRPQGVRQAGTQVCEPTSDTAHAATGQDLCRLKPRRRGGGAEAPGTGKNLPVFLSNNLKHSEQADV